MEVAIKEVQMEGLKKFFLKEPRPFTSKREVNWDKVKTVGISLIGITILGIVVMPTSQPDETSFHEKIENGSTTQVRTGENDPTQEAIRQLQDSQVNANSVHASLDYLYKPSGGGLGGGSRGGQNRDSSMILTRGGADSRTQLSAGTRVSVRLTQRAVIANQAMPVVGIVSNDVENEGGLAIPSGSKVLGDVSFDETTERASISWRSIILPDGRERPFSAIGVGQDGQVGVDGNVHSDGVKNVVGQTLTRFVGAYAAGSMNTGAFGANQGGHANGMRNAIAETATDRANKMGEDLQKERKWIELNSGMDTVAVLNQPFTFRDAGATNGR
jgi:type IV secretory pathway VirB10-like protein